MKMICDVPDEVIKCIKGGTWCGSSVAEKMIANGIPLSSSENPNKCEDDKPCMECPKYDHEKHNCPHFCHVIKGVLKEQPNKSEWQKDHEILKAYSDGANEVLDKIRTEISKQSRMHMDGDYYVKVSECMQIIDRHKAERGE